MSEILVSYDQLLTYDPDMVTMVEGSRSREVAIVTRKNLADFAMRTLAKPDIGARAGLMIDIQFHNRAAGKNYGLAPYIHAGLNPAESGYFADSAQELYELLTTQKLEIPGVGAESIDLLGSYCQNLYLKP